MTTTLALAQELCLTDPERALALSVSIQEWVRPQGDRHLTMLAEALLVQSACLLGLHRPRQALPSAMEALPMLRQWQHDSLPICHNHLGAIHVFLQDYPVSYAHFLQAYEGWTQQGNEKGQAQVLNNLALLHQALGNTAEAVALLDKSLALAEALGDETVLAPLLDSRCTIALADNELDSAEMAGCRSVKLYQQLGIQPALAKSHLHLAEVYLAQGRRPQAETELRAAFALGESLQMSAVLGPVLCVWGQLEMEKQAWDSAEAKLQQALSHVQTARLLSEEAICYERLANVYEARGEISKALTALRRHHACQQELMLQQQDSQRRGLTLLHQHHQIEHTLRQVQRSNADLERELSSRKQSEISLQRTNDALEADLVEQRALVADLDTFAQTVAHDLQSPLNLIVGYSDLVRYLLTNDQTEKASELLGRIEETGLRMSHIIDNVLLLAQVRHGGFAATPLAMDEVVAEALAHLSAEIEANQATILVPESWPTAVGYAPWLLHVWTNYISNAMKYGGQPPVVQLGAEQIGDQVRFWVSDNGPGLSAEQQAQLFQAFKRLDTGRASGHGLGLAIVKRIVSKLHGEVGIQSSGIAGEGATFTFTLPAAP